MVIEARTFRPIPYQSPSARQSLALPITRSIIFGRATLCGAAVIARLGFATGWGGRRAENCKVGGHVSRYKQQNHPWRNAEILSLASILASALIRRCC